MSTEHQEHLCPHCKKPTTFQGNPNRPFCSERCRLIDLGAWANENYRVEGETITPENFDSGSEK